MQMKLKPLLLNVIKTFPKASNADSVHCTDLQDPRVTERMFHFCSSLHDTSGNFLDHGEPAGHANEGKSSPCLWEQLAGCLITAVTSG